MMEGYFKTVKQIFLLVYMYVNVMFALVQCTAMLLVTRWWCEARHMHLVFGFFRTRTPFYLEIVQILPVRSFHAMKLNSIYPV